LTPTNAAIANMGTPNYATNDVAGKLRTECGPDLGVYEFFVDHSVSNLSALPTNICGGVDSLSQLMSLMVQDLIPLQHHYITR